MAELAELVLKNYGLAGALFVGLIIAVGWLLRYTFRQFEKQSQSFERIMNKLAGKLDAMSGVIHEAAQSQFHLADSIENSVGKLEKSQEINGEEHAEIFQFVRAH